MKKENNNQIDPNVESDEQNEKTTKKQYRRAATHQPPVNTPATNSTKNTADQTSGLNQERTKNNDLELAPTDKKLTCQSRNV